MSGDSAHTKDNNIVIGHQVTQTSDVKWLCIENIYQKFHRPNFYDIGGTYIHDVVDFWFMCKTERVGNKFLLHLFVRNRQEVESFTVKVSFNSDLQFNKQTAVAYLPLFLKKYSYDNLKEKTYNYITTYNYSDFEIDLLKDKKLHIAISFLSKFERASTITDIQLRHNFGSLLSDPVASDFTIESQEGEKFKVHKLLLCAHSEVFKAMLKGDTAESQNSCVRLTDVGKEDLCNILEYIYTGTLGELERDKLISLLMLADLYNIKGLMELCQHSLYQQITRENVFDTLAVADMYNADILKTSTLKFIKTNATALHSC